MVTLGIVLTVIGLLLNVLAFFAAPIYGGRIQDWWASRSRARTEERIKLLEEELAGMDGPGGGVSIMVGTLVTVMVDGVLNMLVLFGILALVGVTATLSLLFPHGFSSLGITLSQTTFYWFALGLFVLMFAAIIGEVIKTKRELRKFGGRYAESLKTSLVRLREDLKSLGPS